ncbi:hypothetical protein BGY98DRAFT_1009087 [Russula aff. rugulosa BPL654]|nr:hypothetical protein BGY98DRAFT_1009087 [Russula aff. rugulosa BPL654]
MPTEGDYELELTCLIEGDQDTFLVTLPRTAEVDELRRDVHQRGKLAAFRVRFTEVNLWKVDIDIKSFERDLSEFRLDDHKGTRLSSPCPLLSDLWPEQPPVQHINIYARVKGGRRPWEPEFSVPNPFQELHFASVSAARAAPSALTVANNVGTYKEEQYNHPIYNGRPVDLHVPPVEIYDETLAKLKDDLRDPFKAPEPSTHYIVPERYFNGRSESMEGTIHGTVKDESCGKKSAVLAYLELKDEVGMRGEGGLQAALSLRKFVSQDAYDEIRNVSCCPCIVISLAGPYLRISGAIFVEVFTVQTFTGYIYLGGNPFEMEQIKYVAKVFEAVARANLRVQEHPKFCPPSPTYSPNSPLRLRGILEFKGRVSFEQKPNFHGSLFFAQYGRIAVIVKFCESYGEAAHRILAAEGLAPELRYCSQIVGGAFMMHIKSSKHGDLPPTVLEDIQNALKKLHEAGLVFGDMRRPNIMLVRSRDAYDEDEDEFVEGEWHGQLVDFNWSGPVGKARYPSMLNGRITWASGIEPGGLIEKRHDEDMLGKIVLGIDSNE